MRFEEFSIPRSQTSNLLALEFKVRIEEEQFWIMAITEKGQTGKENWSLSKEAPDVCSEEDPRTFQT